MTIKPFTSKGMVDELRKCGVTHIIWLPDSEINDFYDVIESQNEIAAIPVCREGEAIPIAFGLVLGGKIPVVLQQNTGLLESGESVRAFGLDRSFPLLMLVGQHGWNRPNHPNNSSALYTFPTLDAWGITHYLVETEDDLKKIPEAFKEAQETKKIIAVVFRRGASSHD